MLVDHTSRLLLLKQFKHHTYFSYFNLLFGSISSISLITDSLFVFNFSMFFLRLPCWSSIISRYLYMFAFFCIIPSLLFLGITSSFFTCFQYHVFCLFNSKISFFLSIFNLAQFLIPFLTRSTTPVAEISSMYTAFLFLLFHIWSILFHLFHIVN